MRFDGRNLVSDLSTYANGVGEDRLYWVGMLDECPLHNVDVAGINFPKYNEKLVPSRRDPTRQERVSHPGSLVVLNERKLSMLAEQLPRRVIRMQATPDDNHVSAGENVGDPVTRGRRGYLVKIPASDADTSARQYRPYHYQKGDVPLATFLFAVPCPSGEAATKPPDSVVETGLVWETAEKPALKKAATALLTATAKNT